MRSLRISHTINLMLGSALLAGGVASTYLMLRCAGISNDYTALIQGEIAQSGQARVIQVDFKKQVQAWKDTLLRGKDDAALKKYSDEFHAQAGQVQSLSARLADQITDAQGRASLESFRRQQELLDSQYETALAQYATDRDSTEADTAVKGKDRPPTATLDSIVDRLSQLAASALAAEQAQLHRAQMIITVVLAFIWISIAVWSLAFARTLGLRIAGIVDFVREIAAGDLAVISPQNNRQDELGELIAAMSDMRDRLRETVTSIQTVSSQLGRSAENVASASGQIAHAASEQRAQTTQVAAALEEMIVSVRQVSENCNDATQKAIATGELASTSRDTVASCASNARSLFSEAQSNAETVKKLGEHSRQITQIVTLIEEIAGQTNLLALNAAIEAARAGEHGRGFAVGAGEVRRLAERTTSATKEIAEAVESIHKGTAEAVESIASSTTRVEESVETADHAANALGTLNTSAGEVRHRIEQISRAAEEQSQASGLVGVSMNQIAASINASSDGAEEAARTAEELVALVRKLNNEIAKFRIGGEGRPVAVMPRKLAA
jgi:methyl-accepting chemotaxis protein